MNATISRDRFAWVLKGLAPTVKKRAVIPAMLNVELSVNEDTLTAFCASHGCRMEVKTPVLCSASGVAVVKFDTLEKFVNACKGADVTLSKNDDDSLSLECGKSKIKLNGFDESASPRNVSMEEASASQENVFFMKSREFLSAFKAVGYAAAKDNGENQAYTCARYVSVGADGNVAYAGTDGRRLLECVRCVFNEEENAPVVTGGCSALVPSDASESVQSVLSWTSPDNLVKFGVEGGVLTMSAKHVDVADSEWSCSVSLLDTQYPKYRQVMPTDGFDIRATMPKDAFIDCLKRVMLMSIDEDTPTVTMEMAEDVCVISAHGRMGDARDEFYCAIENGPIQLKCNARFLLDALLAGDFGDDGNVCMLLKSPLDQIHILSAMGDYHYVLMPMRD